MKPEEQLLSGLLDHIQIDETRKQEQIHLLMQEAAHMEPQPKKSLLAQILVQSGYLSRWMLIIQAAFLALGLLLLSGEEYSGIPLQAVLILDAAEVHKSYKYQMWEIEASCANSLREVMLQRLLLSGGITTFILMLLAAFASVQLRISLIQLLSFFLSPFLLVTGSYLYLLRHLRGRMNEMILLAAVILCGMGLMLGLEFLELYTESMLLFSVAVFIVMLLFALRELKRCFSRKERHEWN